jgi:hypothetical protein
MVKKSKAEVTQAVPLTLDERVKKVMVEIVDIFNMDGAGTRHLWNLLTALRGPDSDDEELKFVTTGRIRAVIGMRPYAGSSGAVINPLPLRIDQKETRLARLASPNECHFKNHYELAMIAVRAIYGYELMEEKELGPTMSAISANVYKDLTK